MEQKLWGQSLEKVQTVLWTPKGRGCTLNCVQIVHEPRYAVAFSFVCWQWQQPCLRMAGPVPSLREVCSPAGADIPVSQWWEKVKRQRKQVCLWHSWPLLKLGDHKGGFFMTLFIQSLLWRGREESLGNWLGTVSDLDLFNFLNTIQGQGIEWPWSVATRPGHGCTFTPSFSCPCGELPVRCLL